MKANATKLSSNPLAATRRLSKRLAPQARIRPRKAACGDHPPVEQATSPPKRESVSAKPLAATTRRLSKRLAPPSANPSPQSRSRRPPAG